VPGAPHHTLLVLDATLGQNSIQQAREFQKSVPVTSLALTKLDGTARGGAVLAIAHQLGLPISLVGLGEGIDDWEPFDPEAFARGLFD
jgi:fused signal recognition particle receptor